MRNLGVVGSALLLAFGFAAACAGDDKVKRIAAGGASGADAGSGGAVTNSQGGGSKPAAGAGGAAPIENAGGASSTPPIAEGGAGAGGETMTAAAGTGGVSDGAAGAPAFDCPAEMGNFTPQCADVAVWAPVWNAVDSRLELDVSTLPFPIASGTVSYFYNGVDNIDCGTADVVVMGNVVTAPVTLAFPATNVSISDFSLVDVCGDHYDYDAVGAPACFDIRGIVGTGSTPLDCFSRPMATCPEMCSNGF